jgi:hypothetical protein
MPDRPPIQKGWIASKILCPDVFYLTAAGDVIVIINQNSFLFILRDSLLLSMPHSNTFLHELPLTALSFTYLSRKMNYC